MSIYNFYLKNEKNKKQVYKYQQYVFNEQITKRNNMIANCKRLAENNEEKHLERYYILHFSKMLTIIHIYRSKQYDKELDKYRKAKRK